MPGKAGGGVEDLRAVEPAVGHLHLFRSGIDAMGRGNQGGAVRADEAVLHRPAGLHELGGHHDVDVAGVRGQREHRLTAAQQIVPGGKDLEVIRRCAGALRDARDRSRLHREAAARRGLDQPLGHYAAPFTAQRGDQDRYRSRRQRIAHDATVSLGMRNPVTVWRTLAMNRSHAPGFCTTSAR